MDHLTSIMANDKFRDEKQGTDLSRTVKKVKHRQVSVKTFSFLSRNYLRMTRQTYSTYVRLCSQIVLKLAHANQKKPSGLGV